MKSCLLVLLLDERQRKGGCDDDRPDPENFSLSSLDVSLGGSGDRKVANAIAIEGKRVIRRERRTHSLERSELTFDFRILFLLPVYVAKKEGPQDRS